MTPASDEHLFRPTVTDRICFECGAPGTQRHHVVPKSLGGTAWVWLCDSCHEKVTGPEPGHYAMMRSVRKQRAAPGQCIGGPRFGRKYGYRLVEVEGKKVYAPVRREQRVIAQIVELRNAGYTLMGIVEALADQGIPSPAGLPRWSDMTISRIIRQEGPPDA